MDSPKDIWHFARPLLAKQYLGEFDLGLISARALFAKRRMGKSTFLERDLIPAAKRAGYVTPYLNLWTATRTPAQALLRVVSAAVAPKGWPKVLKRLKGVKSVKTSAALKGIVEGKLEMEWEGLAATVATPLLGDLLDELPSRQRMLLVLDEAQVLARPEHSDLAHSLRANLDSRKASIKVIFAGSSEVTLRQMFGREREPFYNWAPLTPFPLLGEEFVHALTQLVNGLSRYPLTGRETLGAFEALGRTPEFFRLYLSRYLAYASEGSAAALAHTRAEVYNDTTMQRTWQSLPPLDRAVLQLIARGVTDVFSAAVRGQLGKGLGEPAPSIGTVQKAIGRLTRDEVLVRVERGQYHVQDDVFLEWLKRPS
jgi:hypothetical protein